VDDRASHGIYACNLSAREETLVSNGPASCPAASRNRIAWAKSSAVTVKDMSTGDTQTIAAAGSPDLDGDRLVFVRDNGVDDDVVLKNLETGVISTIGAGPGDQIGPRIGGDLAAWRDKAGETEQLIVRNVVTGEVRNLTEETSASAWDWSVGDGRVGWQCADRDIRFFDWALKVTKTIPASAFPPYAAPAFDAGSVYWQDNREGDFDIFGTQPVVTPLSSTVAAHDYSSQASSTYAFRTCWSSAPAPSGSSRWDVKYRVNATGSWQVWKTATSETGDLFTGSPGHAYYFKSRVTAEDQVSDWSAVRSTIVPYDNGSMGFSRYWYTMRHSSLYGRSARYSVRRGSSGWLNARSARAIALVVTRRPTGGYAYVYVNGRLKKRITCYYPTNRARVVYPIAAYSRPVNVKVTVVVAGAKPARSRGHRVEIDGLAVTR
jgi:hypothetical protein